MTLTLVIPALLWPRQVMRDTLFDADFPALQTLLGKGHKEYCAPSADASSDAWWCSQFGLPKEKLPAAALRMAALGQKDVQQINSAWLCADPVHLQVNQRGASLNDPAQLKLSMEEAQQLHASLAPMFENFGELHLTTAGAWHLRLKQDALGLPQNLQSLIGQTATALMPGGDAARPWRHLINDLQIGLHNHPVNRAREARKQTTINSIALWGAGRCPTVSRPAFDSLTSNDLIVAGMGDLAGLKVSALPASFTKLDACTAVYWNRLLAPTAMHDALHWREALLDLENNWIKPALAALGSNHLQQIKLHVFGEAEDDAVSITLSRHHRLMFWRKPRRLETL